MRCSFFNYHHNVYRSHFTWQMQIKITMEKKSCLFSYFDETSMSTHKHTHNKLQKKSARKSMSARIREAKFLTKKKVKKKPHTKIYIHTHTFCVVHWFFRFCHASHLIRSQSVDVSHVKENIHTATWSGKRSLTMLHII